ncbi:MAG TPA: rod-binding protein [Rhodospirillales bacterium]|nr:rod-binding protein [Rhodospirillales bacterium]
MSAAAITSPARLTAAPAAAPRAPHASMSPERLRQAAQEFEAFYLARALEPMFEGLSSEAPFGGGMAEDMWRSLLIDEYGKAIAKAGGIGIADAVVRGLIDLQEHAGAGPVETPRAAAAAPTPVETTTP